VWRERPSASSCERNRPRVSVIVNLESFLGGSAWIVAPPFRVSPPT
jgi:hypothetical protein